MDTNSDINVPPGTNGPESNPDAAIGNVAQFDRTTGAVDPDAARITGIENSGGDDFTASFAEEPRAASTTGKRKYTKRAKPQQPGERQEAPLNINGIEKILFSVHGVLAALTNVPELNLDESEAKKLAKSIEGVTDQYKLTLDPKVAAYIDLASTVSMIYGPRAFSYYLRKKTEGAQKPQPPVQPRNDNVTDIRPATPPNRPQPEAIMPAFDPGKIING